jgi:hypothetical protein
MNAEWLHWYYLIYWAPAAVAVLVLFMSGLGGHRGGHSRIAHGGLRLHAHHGSSHPGASVAHTAHVHATPHAAPHAHGSHGGHHGHQPSPGVGRQMLGFFGVGRAPIPIVIGSLMIGWGLFGLGATELLRPVLREPVLFLGPTLIVASAGGVLTAKLFGELAARLVPADETCAIPREGLLGLQGQVVYPVSESGGRVHIYDRFRTLHTEPARVAPGQTAIEKGARVIVVSMDADRRYLIVEPLGFQD